MLRRAFLNAVKLKGLRPKYTGAVKFPSRLRSLIPPSVSLTTQINSRAHSWSRTFFVGGSVIAGYIGVALCYDVDQCKCNLCQYCYKEFYKSNTIVDLALE